MKLPYKRCSPQSSGNSGKAAGGHDDEAAKKDPDASYGYLINKLGARILQTDSPAFMLNYLRSKGWHD